MCLFPPASRGLWRAAGPQSLYAVLGLPGCGSPPGPAPVSPPCAAHPAPLPTRVWHRCMVCQRVGMAGLLLHHGESGRGAGSGRHLPRVVLSSRPGAGSQRRDGSADGEGGTTATAVVNNLQLRFLNKSVFSLILQDNSKWASGMDEQIMSWATSRPEVINIHMWINHNKQFGCSFSLITAIRCG